MRKKQSSARVDVIFGAFGKEIDDAMPAESEKLRLAYYLAKFMKYFLLLLITLSVLGSHSYAQVSDYISISGKSLVQFKGDSSLSEYVTVRKIVIAGNKRTREKIITREMSIAPNDVLLRDSLDHVLELNKKRLLNLSLFTDVTLTAVKASEGSVDVFVLLKEQWYIFPEIYFKLADRNFNVWWKEQNRDFRRANLGLTVRHRNFRGQMESLSASAQIGYTRRFALEYFKPYLDRQQKHGAGISFSLADNNETYYITDSNKLKFVRTPPGRHAISQFTGALVYVYRPRYSTKHLFEARYRHFTLDDTLRELNPGYFKNNAKEMELAEITYRVEYNNVDNWNYPLTGFKSVGHSITKIGFRGFDFQHLFMLEMSKFNKHGKKWYTSGVFRGRLTFPEEQPYFFRNGLGSESEYVRGYEYYVIDGSQYAVIRGNLKYELVNISLVNLPLKYLPVIPIRIYPKIFADAGYVRNKYPGNSFLNNRPLYSAGVGVDVVSAYDFKVRVEYTWNHLGEKGLFLHINSE